MTILFLSIVDVLVPFKIGTYDDIISCDVIPIKITHIHLIQLCLIDHKVITGH